MTDFYRDTAWPAALADQDGAILRAAEERITGVLTGTRDNDPGLMVLGAYEGVSDEKLGRDVLSAVVAEVVLVGGERTPDIAPETANLAIEEQTYRIRLAFSTPIEIEETNRRAARALCALFVKGVRDSLSFPGALRQTSTGALTNIVGQAFVRRGPWRVVREDWAKRLFVAEFLMAALVNRTLET